MLISNVTFKNHNLTIKGNNQNVTNRGIGQFNYAIFNTFQDFF